MKFRTEIEPVPLAATINYHSRILALGSCFAESISARLSQAKFHIVSSPSGTLFNPLSIASAIRSFDRSETVLQTEIEYSQEVLWFHYGFHGSFSATTATEALERMNAARQCGSQALRTADRIFITFGTAWIYEHNGKIVANCHRQPAAKFVRRRVSVAEIVEEFSSLLSGILSGKEVIFTVSPVRHMGDGLAENSVSKATLRLAVEALSSKFTNAHYFPAYEIVIDDLRDYRFYGDDLVHPTPQAVEYIWGKFAEAALDVPTRQLLPQVEGIVAAAKHRPQNPASKAHKAFCKQQLELIATLPQIDFRTEQDYFNNYLQINS